MWERFIEQTVGTFLVFTCYAMLVNFSSPNLEEQAKLKILTHYGRHLNIFKDKNIALKRWGDKPSEIKKAFLDVRISYKYIEFLLLYVESNEARDINGPNIIVNEYDSLAPEPIYPHGLQVMEDYIYQKAIPYYELNQEVDRLDGLLSQIIQRIKKRHTYNANDFHAIIWDALRYNIYRIESLGITGFDVPKSKNALPETQASLQGMWQILEIYKSIFQERKQLQRFKDGNRLLENAIHYIKYNNQFDYFNRLLFIKEHLHPLSIWLKSTADLMGWKLKGNVKPLNQDAGYLFSADIINPQFFLPGVNESNIALGKKLFNDPILSGDGTRTCATCHNAEKAFADGLTKPISMNGQTLLRNTPTLWNAGLQTKLFYDSRAKKLEKQALDVIHNKEEMGGNLQVSVEKMRVNPEYIEAFQQAYAGTITPYTVVGALAAYIRSLISFNSRFDRYMRNENLTLTDAEKNGFNLFSGKAKCATCHFIPFFNGLVPPNFDHTESEILGVPQNKSMPTIIDSDQGRYLYTRLQLHKYAFKTPDIRNSAFTAPYMHSGVFPILEEVLIFYNNGGGAGQGMDMPTQTLPKDSLHLTSREMNDIISFIKTLSDTSSKNE